MNSLGIDTSMAALEGTRQSQRLLSSPMPFRRTSSIFNSQSVSNLHPDSAPVTHTSSSGHGTPTHSSDYYGGEDDDLKRWERNSRNLLNFLSGGGGGGGGGHGERPNSGIFNNIPFLDDITTSYHGGGGGDSPTNNHSTPITNTKGTSWFMMRPERSNSIIRRRLSLTENSTSTTRHVRVRTKSLMRNTPMMAMTDSADQQDNLATNGKMMPSHSTPTPTRRSITPEQRIQTQQQQHEQNQSQSQPQQPQQLQLQPQLQQQQQQSSQEQSSHNHSIVKHQDWDPSFLKFMRDILRHLLDTGDLNRDDWEEMMMHLLLTIIDEVQPQLRIRDTFNMNHYVKIKKVPGGVPSDSFSVSGVVLSKTVAHKGMMRTIRQPTILILNFDLDGTVTATESQPQEYLKFERLLVWERDHMRALVSEIIQLKPHIVLVASQVPRTLIEHLNKAGIVVAYHVKRTKLEAIARCTDATVFNYKNELWNAKTISPGKCGLFEPLTVMHEYLPNRRKTFLMFRECPKERGATIVLRGGDLKTLTTAKFIMNFMAQLRRDFRELRCWSRSTLAIDDQLGEGSDAEQQQQIIDLIGEQPNNTVSNSVRPATLVASSYHGEGSLASDAPPLDTLSVSALSVAESQVTVNTVDKRRTPGQQQQQQQYYQQTTIMFVDDDDICLTAVNSVLRQYQTTTLSMSPGVSLPVPHLLLKLRETQKRLIGLIRERLGPNITGTTTTLQEEDEGEGGENESIDDNTNREADNDDDSSSNHAISPDTSNKASTPVIPPIPTDLMLMQDYLKSFDAYLEHDLEYRHYQDLHLQCWLMYKKYIGSIPLYLSPIYHQQIIVRRTINPMDDHTIPCEKAVLDPYEYYNPTCDCTLGQYILNSVKEAYYKCSSQMCGGPLIFHDRTYSHGNAQIKVQIFVEEDEAEEDMAVMVEEEGERIEISRDEYLRKIPILICTHCNLCNVTHHWKPMSELLQRYSFGKFLELLFYQSEPVSLFSNHDDNEEEIIGCPHGFYRDHSISFRIQNLSVNFTHETVKVVDVYPPPLHLRFSTKQQMAIKDAALESTRTKIARFFDSIIERNKTFSYDIVHPNMLELCKEYLQELSQEALKNKKHLLQKLQMEYATSAPTDTLQLNNVLADLQNHAVAWDLKYIDVARRFIRPERELRRLTTNHLRKMFPAENIYTSNGSSTAETTVSTNLNLRTKRAIEAADLPLLDVGLYDEDYSKEVVGLKEQPVLSESPTESYPWFDEVKRFDQMFLHTKESTAQTGGAGSDGCAAAALRAGSDATMSTALGSSPKGNTTPSSLLQQQQQEEDVSRDLDPRVARRLSLELMKDSPNKKKMIVEKKAHQQQQQKQLQQQEKKSQGYLEESKIVETNTPMSSANSTPLPSPMTPNATGQNQSQLIVRNNTPINSILSSTAYKRFAGLLPDPVLDKSKSLPSPGQQKKKKEQSRTHQYRKSHYFEAATGSESETAHMTSSSAITTGQRQDLKSSSTTTQQPLLTQTVIKPNAYRGSPYTAKIQDRSPIAYRYGHVSSRGETTRGSEHNAPDQHSSKTTSVLGQQPSGGVNRIGARPISTAGSKEKGYAFTSVLDTSVLEHSRLPVPIRYHRHNLSESNQGSTANNNKMTAVVATATTATTRTIRQRLPSKASLEPYTKIKELTLDDDEASSSDDDDPVMASNETLLGDDEPKVFTFGHRPFSLFYTDEYDECLGREMAPSILELQEFEEEHQVQMTNTTLPFLSLETDMWVENKKEEETSKGTTMIEAAALLRSSASLTLDHGTGSAASFDWTTNGSGRNSIMKAITYVLAEKMISPNEHIFADSNILVREDEPSSIISYMLGSALYNEKLRRKQELRMSKVSPPSFDNREKMANEKPFFSEMFPETDERERPWRVVGVMRSLFRHWLDVRRMMLQEANQDRFS
ncbi:MAG: hypothetical protein EXX96DRAFT_593877 [Benjaminiella poitrasii]|nr:MAG: hypothetical protein EXX96DRAFT_593877 [Benjaminiella poitrasii]